MIFDAAPNQPSLFIRYDVANKGDRAPIRYSRRTLMSLWMYSLLTCYHKQFKLGAHANGVVKFVQILERAW
jgi:hypothetical protein